MGLLLGRFHSAFLDELKAVREELGEDWVDIRRNGKGRAERYYPVLDGLYKLTRELGECADAMTDDRGPTTEDERKSWPGECSFPGMQEAMGEIIDHSQGECHSPLPREKVEVGEQASKGRWMRLVEWLFGVGGGR